MAYRRAPLGARGTINGIGQVAIPPDRRAGSAVMTGSGSFAVRRGEPNKKTRARGLLTAPGSYSHGIVTSPQDAERKRYLCSLSLSISSALVRPLPSVALLSSLAAMFRSTLAAHICESL